MKWLFYAALQSSRLVPLSSFLFLILTISIPVMGCVNPIGQSLVGASISLDGVTANEFVKGLTAHEQEAYWKETLAELQRRRKNLAIENRINIAVAMIHLGQVKEAIQILEKLEKEKPGLYHTAANLGTAYELNGENQKALRWITEGVSRDKTAHSGTEWLHIRILEAKLAMEKDPAWLDTHSVITGRLIDDAVEAQNDHMLLTDDAGLKKTLEEIEYALIYQLHERLEFVKPPEPIVAELLFELGKIVSLTRTPEHEAAVRTFAASYGVDSGVVPLATSPEKPLRVIAETSSNYPFYKLVSLVGILIVVGGLYIFRRKRLI